MFVEKNENKKVYFIRQAAMQEIQLRSTIAPFQTNIIVNMHYAFGSKFYYAKLHSVIFASSYKWYLYTIYLKQMYMYLSCNFMYMEATERLHCTGRLQWKDECWKANLLWKVLICVQVKQGPNKRWWKHSQKGILISNQHI